MTVTQPSIDDASARSGPPKQLTTALLDSWLEAKGPVALHLRQRLLPVEGEPGVIFPPTYADIGYNVDTLADGTYVAMIDTVGSQANRLEPIFKRAPDGEPDNELAKLVPQIEIVLHRGKKKGDAEHMEEKRALLDLAHRGADAVVLASPTLSDEVGKAFETLRRTGNAAPLCAIAPTSLVFGVWDSRGGSGEKRPRLVRAIIRAWDVEILHSAAQFNSVWKALSEEQQEALEKDAKSKRVKLSEKGFADAPATFRKTKISEYRDGSPNPEARVLGGVFTKGPIERDVTVNLVALRGLRGKDAGETAQLRRYLLGLSLLAATADIDLFLREGCLLRYADDDVWSEVPRRGAPNRIDLASGSAREAILSYTENGAKYFRPRWPSKLEHDFDLKRAKELLAKKDEAEGPEGGGG